MSASVPHTCIYGHQMLNALAISACNEWHLEYGATSALDRMGTGPRTNPMTVNATVNAGQRSGAPATFRSFGDSLNLSLERSPCGSSLWRNFIGIGASLDLGMYHLKVHISHLH
jgi:hypothetical protein